MARVEMIPWPVSVLDVYAERDSINLVPVYQRISGVWDLRKRRLLIDSIVNGIDLPKIYFHELSSSLREKRLSRFAVIDGKQRLETIFDFIDGEIRLPDEFVLFEDPEVAAGGASYDDLASRFPRLRARFDATKLSIVVVRSDDIDLIEELFSRLNEAVPLTAPEFRNTLGGPLPRLFREISAHPFFTVALPFETGRHRYLDLAAKFCLIQWEETFASTKKIQLDRMVRTYREASTQGTFIELKLPAQLRDDVEQVLDEMAALFTYKDPLLDGIGWVTLWFHVFRLNGRASGVTREHLVEFMRDVAAVRWKTRQIASGRIAGALDADEISLAQFDSYRQSPNDGSALRARYEILSGYFQERGVALTEVI